MLSPGTSKKNNGYLSLSDDKPKPPPKPTKQPLSKTISSPVLPPPPPPKPRSTSFSELPPPSFFSPGGGPSFGYCLPAIHKTRLDRFTSEDGEGRDHDATPIDINHSPFKSKSRSLHGNRPKFKPPEKPSASSRPQLAALPAKFRAAFAERSKKNVGPKELSSTSSPDIGCDLSKVEHRPPSITEIEYFHDQQTNLLSLSKSLPATTSVPIPPVSDSSSIKSDSGSMTSLPEIKLGSLSPRVGSISPELSPSIITSSSLQLPVTFAQPPPREMEYFEREHPRNVFERLSKLRDNGDLCDVILIVNSNEIRAHRIVLASCSQYFESMFIGEFAEPVNEPVFIEEVDEDSLTALVDFAYTSHIKLTDRNIYSIFEAADVLGFTGVKSSCFKFFKQQMNKSNCIGTWLFAQDNNCTELLEASLKYIECNFLDIARGREFLSLDRPEVVSQLAALEDVAITSEEQVYEAVLGWVYYDLEKRRTHAPQVFEKVRFPSMSRDFLLHIVDHELLIKEDPDLLQQLINALETHVSTMRATLRRKLIKKGGAGSLSGLIPRPASMAIEMVEVNVDNAALGIRIMGGVDRPKHVFRQGDKPGILILQVLSDGAADKCGRLRAGDRMLRVNSEDVSNATHEHVIRLLKMSPSPLSLLVRHEPPPPGLMEVTLVTKPGEGFGFSVSGGVNSVSGNPLDETDEGLFISQIIPGGAAEQDPRLTVGLRILQVNSLSMLGKTHDEALQMLHVVLDRMNLLVCRGYDPSTLDGHGDEEEGGVATPRDSTGSAISR